MSFSLAAGSKAKPRRHFPAFDFPDFTLSYRVSRWEKLLRRLVFICFSEAKCKVLPCVRSHIDCEAGLSWEMYPAAAFFHPQKRCSSDAL